MEALAQTICIEKDEHGLECGLPAEIIDHYTLFDEEGALVHLVMRCLAKHNLNCPADAFPDSAEILAQIYRSQVA